MRLGRVNRNTEKTCPSATLSITNPTLPDLGSNPGHRDGKPAINRLSYGMAFSRPKKTATIQISVRIELDTEKHLSVWTTCLWIPQ
jgi:hypothetical protein